MHGSILLHEGTYKLLNQVNKTISTAAGILILAVLGLLAGSLIWWQGELTEREQTRASLVDY